MADELDLTNTPGWEAVGRLIGMKIASNKVLKSENERLKQRLKDSNDRTLVIKRLEIENERMKQQMKDVDWKDVTNLERQVRALETQILNQKRLTQEALDKAAGFRQRFEVLQADYRKQHAAWIRMREENHEAKRRVQLWQTYLKEKEKEAYELAKKQQASPNYDDDAESDLPEEPLTSDDVYTEEEDPTPRQPNVSKSTRARGPSLTGASPAEAAPAEASQQFIRRRDDGFTSSKTLVNDAATDADSPSRRVTSSQTTDDPAPSSPSPAEREPRDDEEPQVIKARPVNKKRRNSAAAMPPPIRIKQESNSRDAPIVLKSEDSDGPKHKRQKLSRVETSDLDALVEHAKTPRKRRGRKGGKASTAPPKLAETATETNVTAPNGAEIEDSDGENIEEEMSMPSTIPQVEVLPPSANSNRPRPGTNAQSKASSRKSEPLSTLSPNVPSGPKDRRSETEPKKKRVSTELSDKIRLVSEDGDEENSQVATAGKRGAKRKSNDGRLNDLLDAPAAGSEALPKRVSPDTTTFRPAKSTKPKVASRKANEDVIEAPSPAKPEDEPLRARPLRALRLDDFRINPSYMGADFAFADTIRGKENRKCLRGCTRPECCGGAFLKAIEFSGDAAGSTGNVNGKTDDQVLEDFLGANWRDVIGAYGPEKRKDLLTQARAFAFANAHGKHRAAFERHSTPPGFWRTDMPTTQEELEDREKALEMERGKVEERWREAMRENGRWKFKDE